MWDCHSCDPGSNPGPGVQPSLRILTPTNIDDDIIRINLETDTSSIQQQQQKDNSGDNYKVATLFEVEVVQITVIVEPMLLRLKILIHLKVTLWKMDVFDYNLHLKVLMLNG